jgi:periplasmic divalent cation tolerance protein
LAFRDSLSSGLAPTPAEPMSTDLRIVLTTCPSRDLADQLAFALVKRRLAACVNVIPSVSSTYRWAGKIERDSEVLLIIKTAATEIAAIEAAVRAISGYDLPELVAIEISGGSSDYLAWVAASVGEEAV